MQKSYSKSGFFTQGMTGGEGEGPSESPNVSGFRDRWVLGANNTISGESVSYIIDTDKKWPHIAEKTPPSVRADEKTTATQYATKARGENADRFLTYVGLKANDRSGAVEIGNPHVFAKRIVCCTRLILILKLSISRCLGAIQAQTEVVRTNAIIATPTTANTTSKSCKEECA